MSDLTNLLRRGTVPAGELARALDVSAATLMRRVRADADRVVRLGRTRSTRYGLRRDVPGLGESEWPVYRVDDNGDARPVGSLVALVAHETAWQPAGAVFNGLPPEVEDMRPQGFLGRSFPRHHADLPVPPRIGDWNNDHILVAITRRGEDTPGNLIVGDASYGRWATTSVDPIGPERYPDLAASALAGEPVGSSAGGEQPKFAVFTGGRHVLVKFARYGNEAGQRWCDLLALENIALTTLADHGVTAATTRVIDDGPYRFLEVERFDRVGARGRRPVVSLAAAWQELHRRWSECAGDMQRAALLSESGSRRIRLHEAFGRMIGNTDLHHYNVLLVPRHDATSARIVGYEVAPAFDQLPMTFAPTASGTVRPLEYRPPVRVASVWDVWDEALRIATEFWRRASADDRMSTAVRDVCARAAVALQASA